ncbi:hypothetical protein RP20_CCG015228 [Aedes albopictus]|nr:hypothetical protein RP20_CCG015228 [Aedes albopictus]
MGQQYFTRFFLPIATAIAFHYECAPYSVRSVCRIEYISYQPGDQISFPAGYQHYYIKQKSMRVSSFNVTIFDQQLYEAMHRPTGIEMTSTRLEELILPTELLLGDFSSNHIETVNTTNGENFLITYLDLSSNMIRNVDFVSPLVNLEVLHLGHNSIEAIPGSALSTLTKLKYLYLQSNYYITSIPWSDIPRSIIHLDFDRDGLTEVVFTNIGLPSLEYLNIRHNELLTINITELLRAIPNLKEAHLYNSGLGEEQMRKIYADLTANNISFTNPFDRCQDDEQYSMTYGDCIKRQEADPFLTSRLRGVLLSLVVVATALVFVCMVLLVFKHMNR